MKCAVQYGDRSKVLSESESTVSIKQKNQAPRKITVTSQSVLCRKPMEH
jgi:hypothetical protein